MKQGMFLTVSESENMSAYIHKRKRFLSHV